MFYQAFESQRGLNTGSWSAGAFIPLEPDHHDVMQHWIQINRSLYTSWTESAWCYITMYPDQQERLTQKNQINKTLSKLDPHQEVLYQRNLVRMILYNTGLWSAGVFIHIEPDQHDVIQLCIVICRKCYTRKTGSARWNIIPDPINKT